MAVSEMCLCVLKGLTNLICPLNFVFHPSDEFSFKALCLLCIHGDGKLQRVTFCWMIKMYHQSRLLIKNQKNVLCV